eukprot:3309016-Pyramimonas_sp.AAC.1
MTPHRWHHVYMLHHIAPHWLPRRSLHTISTSSAESPANVPLQQRCRKEAEFTNNAIPTNWDPTRKPSHVTCRMLIMRGSRHM